MRVALITEVFFDDPEGYQLTRMLIDAAGRGADVAVLPELPLNGWSPYSKVAKPEDAEPVGGPRQTLMATAAREAGIALVGGAIIADEAGVRHNTAIVYDRWGNAVTRYRKIHLPEEEGYWETSHYEPGTEPPRVVEQLPLRSGLQICSDVNRPQGFQLLAAQGAEVVFAPRATPPGTYERWRIVLRANAVMSGAYLVSVNRPRPENGASIGGPSIAISPDGNVLAETTEPVAIVELERSVVEEAAGEYPGYLKRFGSLYADAWRDIAGG